jgi:hypothetical protein
MSNIHAHELHQMVRSWLLAEDPYGVNQRQEPTMGTAQPQLYTPGSVPKGAAPGRNPTAQSAGEGAVANALTPASGADALRASNYGRGAVDRELQKPPTPNTASEAFQGARDPRAQAWGEQAVGQSTAPSPTAEVDRTRAQAWGESAVDKALNPPTGTGGGFWMPGEAADTASAVGEQAVGGELAKKARSKMARGRLKDPIDTEDRQPD